MNLPEDEVLRRLVGDWIRRADIDFRSAQSLLAENPPLLSTSCFHSQQAAEKYLKAFLTRRQIEFPKTHNIKDLLNLVATVDADLSRRLRPATALTPYGVEMRYPGESLDPTLVETKDAFALAALVRDAMTTALQADP